MTFYSILNHEKSLLKHEMMLITQKMLNLKCLFHGKVMRVYKLLFYPSKKSVNFCYNKVSFIFFQKENYFSKQCAIDRRSDNPTVHDFGYNDNTVKNQFSVRGNLTLKEMCKVLQKSLMKYVMNFCRNEENERSLVLLAVGRVRDY